MFMQVFTNTGSVRIRRIAGAVSLCLFVIGLVMAPPGPVLAQEGGCPEGEQSVLDPTTDSYVCIEGGGDEKPSPEEVGARYTGFCWCCKVFIIFFDAAGEFSYDAFAAVNDAMADLIAVGLAVWFAFKALQTFTSVSGFGVGEFFREVGARFFVATAIILLMTVGGVREVFGYLIEPILNGAISLGAAYLSVATDSDPCSVSGGPTYMAGSAFTVETKENFICLVDAMNSSITQGIHLGLVTFWEGWDSGLLSLPQPARIIGGLMIAWIFFKLLVNFLFLMMDVMIRVGMIGGLLPLFLGAWVFPQTRSISQQGWHFFLNTMIYMVVICLMLALLTMMIDFTLQEADTRLQEAISSGEPKKIAHALAMSAAAFPILWSVTHSGYDLVLQSADMADQFSQVKTKDMNVGEKSRGAIKKLLQRIAMLVAAVATGGGSVAAQAAKAVGKLAKAGKAMKKAAGAVKSVKNAAKKAHRARAAMKKVANAAGKVNKVAGAAQKVAGQMGRDRADW